MSWLFHSSRYPQTLQPAPQLFFWQNKTNYCSQNYQRQRTEHNLHQTSELEIMASHMLRTDTWKLLFITAHMVHCLSPTPHIFSPPWSQMPLLNCVKWTVFTGKYEMEVCVKSLPYPVWFLSKKILKLKRTREGAFFYNLIICWQWT